MNVLGTSIDVIDARHAVDLILDWAERRESRTVCACNVHSAVQARTDQRLAKALAQGDLVVADGAPIAWLMRRLGASSQRRIAGPDLMILCLEAAAARGQSVFLYGSTELTLERLEMRLRERIPGLSIAGRHAPPFADVDALTDDETLARINDSGAHTVWVALGCPKQEAWIAAHRDRIRAVLIGVGAAFDFHAGVTRRAPMWMQRSGLEWLHRLASEPRRLFRRYAITNLRFVALALSALLSHGLQRGDRIGSSARPARP